MNWLVQSINFYPVGEDLLFDDKQTKKMPSNYSSLKAL